MDLDEAITHAEEVAERSAAGSVCAQDHQQLAAWLKDYKAVQAKLKLAESIIEDAADFPCDRAEYEGAPCEEVMQEEDAEGNPIPEEEAEPLWPDPADWCTFCRARLWLKRRKHAAKSKEWQSYQQARKDHQVHLRAQHRKHGRRNS